MLTLSCRQLPAEDKTTFWVSLDKSVSGLSSDLIKRQPLSWPKNGALVLAFPQTAPVLFCLELASRGMKSCSLTSLMWVCFLAYRREKLEQAPRLKNAIADFAESSDWVYGSDIPFRMPSLLDDFLRNRITDDALSACMNELRYGSVHILTSSQTKKKVRSLSGSEISPCGWSTYCKDERTRRLADEKAAETIIRKNRRNGRFFDEILEDAEQNGVQVLRFLH